MSSPDNSLMQISPYKDFFRSNESKIEDLSSIYTAHNNPPRVLPTYIFNDSQNYSPAQNNVYPVVQNRNPTKRETKVKVIQKTSAPKRKMKENSKKSRKRPASAKVRQPKKFAIDKIPNLNVEIDKIVKLFQKHSLVCHDMKSDLLKQGGSKLIKY